MTDINDDELRSRFNALRTQDGRGEPEFGEMLDRARRSARTDRPRFGSSVRWAAIAAGILIAATLLAGKARDLGRKQQLAEVMAITTWQSPTAGLLEPPARGILAPPPLLSSVFDGVTSPTLSLKTD